MKTTRMRIHTIAWAVLIMLCTSSTGVAQDTQDTAAERVGEQINLRGNTELSFLITQNTDRAELNRIQRLANEVGVNFDFEMSRKDKRMNRLHAYLPKSPKNAKHLWKLRTGKAFNLHIGWEIDGEGDAIALIDEMSQPLGKLVCEFDRHKNWDDKTSAVTSVQTGTENLTLLSASNADALKDKGIVTLRLMNDMSPAYLKSVEQSFSNAGITHELIERNRNRRVVKLAMTIPGSSQTFQMKLEGNEPWQIDVAWRTDTYGRAVAFLDADELTGDIVD